MRGLDGGMESYLYAARRSWNLARGYHGIDALSTIRKRRIIFQIIIARRSKGNARHSVAGFKISDKEIVQDFSAKTIYSVDHVTIAMGIGSELGKMPEAIGNEKHAVLYAGGNRHARIFHENGKVDADGSGIGDKIAKTDIGIARVLEAGNRADTNVHAFGYGLLSQALAYTGIRKSGNKARGALMFGNLFGHGVDAGEFGSDCSGIGWMFRIHCWLTSCLGIRQAIDLHLFMSSC